MDARQQLTQLNSLPLFITDHPLFHKDITEVQGKAILSMAKENYLFCPSANVDQCLLVYRASFRGNQECRSIPLTVDKNNNEISHTSLGKFSTLGFIANQLTPFLQGFADAEFTPTPLYSHTKFNTNVPVVCDVIPPLSNDMVKEEIFRRFDTKTLINARYVSRSWSSFVNKLHLMTSFDENVAAEYIERQNKIAFVFDTLRRRNQRLIFANHALSPAEEYGMGILLSFNKIHLANEHAERLSQIGYKSDDFNDCHFTIFKSNSNYEINGINGDFGKNLTSIDKFINLLMLFSEHGGADLEQSIEYLEETQSKNKANNSVMI